MSTTETETWLKWVMLFLACDCFIMIVYNMGVLFYKRVYSTWSTTSILLSCTMLLATRIGSLYFFAAYGNVTNSEKYLLCAGLIDDAGVELAVSLGWWGTTTRAPSSR